MSGKSPGPVSGSYYVIIPKEIVKELEWKERQKVKIKRSGK